MRGFLRFWWDRQVGIRNRYGTIFGPPGPLAMLLLAVGGGVVLVLDPRDWPVMVAVSAFLLGPLLLTLMIALVLYLRRPPPQSPLGEKGFNPDRGSQWVPPNASPPDR